MPRLAWWRAVRAPVFWLVAAWVLRHSPALRARLVLWQSAQNPFHDFFCAAPSFHDCFFFLPSSMWSAPVLAKLFGSVLAMLLAAALLRPRLATWRPRRDGLVAFVALLIAAACVGWLHVRGPNIRLLPVFVVATLLLWALLACNLGLRPVDRVLQRRRVGRVLDWTFPISDIVCCARNRQRFGAGAGRWQWLPVAALALLLVAAAGHQLRLATAGSRAEPLPVTLYDPRQVAADAEGAWIAEAISRYDAGLWRYDRGAGEARSVLRAADVEAFAVQEGRLCLADGFDRTVVCLDARTRAVAWRAPLPTPSGRVTILAAPAGRLVAVGERGIISVMDSRGKPLVEHSFPHSIWHPQVLADGRLAFVAPEPASLVVLDSTLAPTVSVPLRVADGAFPLPPPTGGAGIRVVTGLAALEERHLLCVATLWGEILRYDLRARAWMPSLWTGVGLSAIAGDGPRGLLVVYHAPQATVEVVDASTGARRTLACADAFGTTLSLDRRRSVAYLSAHGPGFTSLPRPGAIYRLAYGG